MQRLAQINMVLIGTTHPGNIGAAARAIKVMGLNRLSLLNPETYQLVFGTSSRSRGMKIPMIDMRQAAEKMITGADQGLQVAMLFGKERYGLTNEEMQRCHYLVKYPANPE